MSCVLSGFLTELNRSEPELKFKLNSTKVDFRGSVSMDFGVLPQKTSKPIRLIRPE